MLDKNNEVFFGEYCKTCKYKNYSETDCPCSECIAEPVNLYSHKPIRWEGADGVFSGPPPRPDHAYQRAVKYVPERRKDKEKAIARQNIDAEYAGNKVQSISDDVTDDQYPSATAVKKALESKIDAPQVAQVGEVLTVEEVDADGNPKKWKTQKVEKDWNENDPTKPGYIKNRTHYKYSDEFLGEIAFTATSEKELIMEDQNSTENYDIIDAIGKTALTEHNNTKIIIDGEVCISNAFFSRYVTQLVGEFNYSAGGPAGYQHPAVVNNDGIVLVPGNVYVIQFYNVGEYYKPLSEKYLPNTIFSQSNAPVKFGTNPDGTLNNYSAVQGYRTEASKQGSHAEGSYSRATRDGSHAEGSNTEASGYNSHAEGDGTKASGTGAHSEGEKTVANTKFLHTSGRFNLFEDRYYSGTERRSKRFYKSDDIYHSSNYTFDSKTGKFTLVNPVKCDFSNFITRMFYIIGESPSDFMYFPTSLKQSSSSWIEYDSLMYSAKDRKEGYKTYGTYAHIVGNGESDSKRSNAYTLDWEGNAWFAGDVYVHSTSGTNKDEGSVRLATEDQLTDCVRLSIRMKKNGDGTITYFTDFTALFVYYEIFKGRPIDTGNSVECCLIPIESESLTILNYTGMSIDQNSDGNIVLAIRFSSYASGKQISAEIKDTISGIETDDEEILSTVVTVTENALVSYSMMQELTREQQELAKQNIGAGTLRKVYYWDVTNDTLEAPNSVMRCAVYGDTCICLDPTRLPHGMVGPVLVIYGEISYGRRDATAFDGSNATWTFSVNLNDYSYSTPIKKSGIPTPTTAQVGQIVKVKAVDTDGKITETETVDMSTIVSVTYDEETGNLQIGG